MESDFLTIKIMPGFSTTSQSKRFFSETIGVGLNELKQFFPQSGSPSGKARNPIIVETPQEKTDF